MEKAITHTGEDLVSRLKSPLAANWRTGEEQSLEARGQWQSPATVQVKEEDALYQGRANREEERDK